MEMSPNQVRTASFATARKGWDPSEVTAFLERAAEALESAQNHATAMEARARAAVSKLQEVSASGPPASGGTPPQPTDDQAETISRTLLLAQRAADEAVAEARATAERMIAEARDEARRADSEERHRARAEVDALMARREFLQSDVEQLENFLIDQRERLRSAASSLVEMAEQVPQGLGYLRPPLLSASDDDTPDETSAADLRITTLDVDDDGAPTTVNLAGESDLSAPRGPAVDGDPPTGDDAPAAENGPGRDEPASDDRPDDVGSGGHGSDDATMPITVIREPVGEDDPTPEGLPLRFAPGVEDDGGPDRSGGPGR